MASENKKEFPKSNSEIKSSLENESGKSRESAKEKLQNLAKPPRSPEQVKKEKEAKAKYSKAREELALKQAEIKLQQHRRKILLAGCEPVMGLNYNSLAMDDYPENSLVAAARRDRDYWVVICCVFSMLFIFSFIGIVSPWLGGVGCGLAFLSAIFAFTPVRKFFFDRPHLHELLALRKRIEYTALHHIQYLEGMDGLAWRCEKLSKFNSNLSKPIFSGLYRYSKMKNLLDYLKDRKSIRLYLLLMIEAQKAYKRLEKDYLESHFKHMEQGWDDRIDASEVKVLEKMLNDVNAEEGESRIS